MVVSLLCLLTHLNDPMPYPKFLHDSWPEGLQPLKQCRVRAVSDAEPDNLWATGVCHAANREVFVFCHDAPSALNRKTPNLTIVGIA
jgi:hypothetical protein